MFVIKRRSFLIISVLLACVITAIFCFGALSINSTNSSGANAVKIVLDAGHGGIDGGVSGVNTGIKESVINLSVVKKLEKCLVNAGFLVVLTRTSDAGLYGLATKNLKRKDLLKRKEIIEKANPTLVISIHMNKYSVSSRRGAQVFYKKGDENAQKLAESVQKSLNLMETASRSCSVLTGDYYILNCTNYPSIIVECGFLSNPEDEALLVNDSYQEDLSYTIFKGIVEYLSVLSIKFCD